MLKSRQMNVFFVKLFLVNCLWNNLTPYLHLNLKTCTRYPMAETWDLKVHPTFAPLHRP